MSWPGSRETISSIGRALQPIVFGSRLPDFYLHVADWMRDALDDKFGFGYKKRIDHAAR